LALSFEENMKLLYKTLILLACFIAFIKIMDAGFARQEKLECRRWQAQEKEFENFYWEDWQIEQCKIK